MVRVFTIIKILNKGGFGFKKGAILINCAFFAFILKIIEEILAG